MRTSTALVTAGALAGALAPALAAAPAHADVAAHVDAVRGLFEHDGGRVRLYPTAFVETGLEPSIGGRLELTDLAGVGETLRLRAGYAGDRRVVLAAHASTGRALGPVALELGVRVQRRDDVQVWGVDAMDDDVTRTRLDDGHAQLAATITLGDLALRPAVTYRERRHGVAPGDAPPMVVGFVPRQRAVEGELGATWTRGGVRVGGWLGLHHGVDGDASTHPFGGVDVTARRRLRDDVTLDLRALVHGVGGDASTIAFADLPALGGSASLRGYPSGRFRDRWAALGVAELTWEAHRRVDAFVFVDVGAVAPEVRALATGAGARASAGAGVALRGLGLRAHVAATTDGDVGLVFTTRDPIRTHPRDPPR